ncbi:uncharacterized protein LOC121869422 [Homarus americanus]|uniref:Uncharacterized protein n=1 Tax=Homarus americanus TaxID=6706 RepID=A0A8J5K3D7_HOMAM|nr:uncharacterized protein LOC121869422 [Homarus americanus]KAG7166300.1 hypothetical protein Hamer_G011129 [Homarus americanus]
MRLGVTVCVVAALLTVADGLVGPNSGVPGGIIAYLWVIAKVALSVVLLKKGLEDKKYDNYERRSHHTPPLPYLVPSLPGRSSPSAYPNTRRNHKRAIEEEMITREMEEMVMKEVKEVEKLLLSAATHLDTDGCVLKLLCHLNNKQVDGLSQEEAVLLKLFHNTSTHKTQDQATCDQMFPQCVLKEVELSSLQQETWGCGTFSV